MRTRWATGRSGSIGAERSPTWSRAPDGKLLTAKLLSEYPGRYDDAAVAAIRRLTGAGDGPLPPCAVRIGTTAATNALLERKGARVCFVTTRGFADALLIVYQNRPNIFAREIVRPAPLYERVIEVEERVMADGTVDRPLDLPTARAALLEAYGAGLRATATVRHGSWAATSSCRPPCARRC